jgi:hypothetical protein
MGTRHTTRRLGQTIYLMGLLAAGAGCVMMMLAGIGYVLLILMI